MDKVFFTLEEAQGCVNWLKEQFEAIQSLRNKIYELDQKIQTLESGVSLNGGGSISGQISNYSSEKNSFIE